MKKQREVAGVILPVWAVMWDGPMAGLVCEVGVNDRELQIPERDGGVHQYRRKGWSTAPRGHYIATFKFTKTLVI